MSSTISIPTAPTTRPVDLPSPSSDAPSSAMSSLSLSPRSGGTLGQRKSSSATMAVRGRRPSLLGPAISTEECTLISIEEPDGRTRLISYLSSGQGFLWNPEIFLPSYVKIDYVPLDERKDPVQEIILSEDEIKNMLPQ